MGDWGQFLLYANKLGRSLAERKYRTERILIINEGKLGGFHINDSNNGDEDLTSGSMKPY